MKRYLLAFCALLILVSQAVGGLAIGGVGGDASLGGAIAQRADEFNRQLHPTEQDLIRDNAAAYAVELGLCESESTCSEAAVNTAESILVRQALYQVDEIFSQKFSENGHARDFLVEISAKYAESIAGNDADIDAGLHVDIANYGTFEASDASFKDHFENIQHIYTLEDAYAKVLNEGEIAALKVMNSAHNNLLMRGMTGSLGGLDATISGIGDLAVMIATNPEQLAEIAQLIADNPSLFIDGVIEPFQDRYEAGDIAGAVGYALPSVLELLVGTKGVGTVTKGGKTTLDIPDNPDDFIDILKSNTDNDLPDAPTIVDDLADTGGTTPGIIDGVGDTDPVDGGGGNGVVSVGNELADVISDGGQIWNKTTFNGRPVYKNNNAFDPSRVDTKGRTNIERMNEGLAPIGKDGKSVELHHMTQSEVNGFNGSRGAVAEVTNEFHNKNYNTIHIYRKGDPEYVSWRKNNPQAEKEFEAFRKQYWKDRAGDF